MKNGRVVGNDFGEIDKLSGVRIDCFNPDAFVFTHRDKFRIPEQFRYRASSW